MRSLLPSYCQPSRPASYTLKLGSGERVHTKRVVCAMGPNLRKDKLFWESGAAAGEPRAVWDRDLVSK